MRLLLIVLGCCMMAVCAAEPGTNELKKIERVTGHVFAPANTSYPPELVKAGVQGEVLVIVTLTPDGRSQDAVLGNTSGSDQLDKIALEFVKATPRQVKEAPARGWRAVVVPVAFHKDSVTSLKSKTCAEFNTDFAYQRTTFPYLRPDELRIFKMLTDMLYLGKGARPAQAASLAKRAAAAMQPTIDSCQAHPGQLLLPTWRAAVEAAS